jgi:hypothetical protein
MIVKFFARNGQLTMFGNAATALLKLLGHSGSIPGAILTVDLPAALAQLRAGLERDGDTPAPEPAPTRNRDARGRGCAPSTRHVAHAGAAAHRVDRGRHCAWVRPHVGTWLIALPHAGHRSSCGR